MNTLSKRETNLLDGLMETILNDQKILKTSETLHQYTSPAYNIKESETEFIIELAAPGLQKENFKIEVTGNVLKVNSIVSEKSEESNMKFTRKEFNYQSFKKNFSLPKNANLTEEVSAKYENGVLMIKILKQLKSQDTVKKVIVE